MGKDEKKSAKVYDWRADMAKAGQILEKAAGDKKKAGERLWKATKAGITEWISAGGASDDSNADGLYAEFLAAYGEQRQGDCSKMRGVALAARDKGLDLAEFRNLSQAYTAANRLNKEEVAKTVEAEEDRVAEKLTELIAKTAPEKASTSDEAAKFLIAKGLDETARALVDALGPDSSEAHRALLRAINREVGSRVKAAKPVAEAKAHAAEVKAETKKPSAPVAKAAEPKADKPKAEKAKPAAPVAAPKEKTKVAAPKVAAPKVAAPVAKPAAK